jgi:hypothetical protein
MLAAVVLPRATGQTIQLPAFDRSGIATTLIVPDRGGAILGGIRRIDGSQTLFGPPLLGAFSPRTIRYSRGAGSISTRVWIHDFRALDRALLEQAARRRGADNRKASERSAFSSTAAGQTLRASVGKGSRAAKLKNR